MSDESKYPIINQVLQNFEDKEEIHLWDSELDDLIGAVQMQVAYDSNYGIRKERVKHEHGQREFSFQQEWLKENLPTAGYGYYGIIQALFVDSTPGDSLSKVQHLHITNRDRVIVATIIQWLGSNIGFSFLERALNGCDYVLERKEAYDEKMVEVRKARDIINKAKEMLK